jgi:hypothetical protein
MKLASFGTVLIPRTCVDNGVQPESDPDDGRPRLVRRSPLRPAQKLCPRCLHPVRNASKLGGWLIPMNYYCANCGYTGTAFLEKTSNEAHEEP